MPDPHGVVRHLIPNNEPDKQSLKFSADQSLCTCVQALAADNAALLRKVKSLEGLTGLTSQHHVVLQASLSAEAGLALQGNVW